MQVSVVAILVKNNTARDFKRIVHMEPTPVEMQSFTTVESVFVWAQLKGEPLQNCYTSWVLKMMITHEFWLLCRRLIGMGQSRSGPHLPSLRRRL